MFPVLLPNLVMCIEGTDGMHTEDIHSVFTWFALRQSCRVRRRVFEEPRGPLNNHPEDQEQRRKRRRHDTR